MTNDWASRAGKDTNKLQLAQRSGADQLGRYGRVAQPKTTRKAMENPGFDIFNPAPEDQTDKTVVVLGLPRGGTTMAARLVQALGTYIGDDLPMNYEDRDVARILTPEEPDQAAFRALVAKRNADHTLWGYKFPFRFHQSLLAELRNPRVVVVFRDVLSVAVRNRMSARVEVDVLESMAVNINKLQQLTKWMRQTTIPVFAFSYEKTLQRPRPLVTGLAEFLGRSLQDDQLMDICALVQPSAPDYVTRIAQLKQQS